MSEIDWEKYDDSPEKFFIDQHSMPNNIKKYWRQRYNLFSRFDEGVYMNHELWYSVTPEKIAIFIAKFIHACDPTLTTICDVFCGGGGNTIQFARKFDKVIGIDISEENLYCTKKNCEVYGVEKNVELQLGSWLDIIKSDRFQKLQNEVNFVFASPPWGGPAYKNKELFDLDYLIPLPIYQLLESFFKITKNVCLFLPKNTDVSQLSQVTKDLLGEEAQCRIIYTHFEGFLKGMFVFWGEKYMPQTDDSQINQDEWNSYPSFHNDATIYDEEFHRDITEWNTNGFEAYANYDTNEAYNTDEVYYTNETYDADRDYDTNEVYDANQVYNEFDTEEGTGNYIEEETQYVYSREHTHDASEDSMEEIQDHRNDIDYMYDEGETIQEPDTDIVDGELNDNPASGSQTEDEDEVFYDASEFL